MAGREFRAKTSGPRPEKTPGLPTWWSHAGLDSVRGRAPSARDLPPVRKGVEAGTRMVVRVLREVSSSGHPDPRASRGHLLTRVLSCESCQSLGWGSAGLGRSGRGLKLPRESRTDTTGDREMGFTGRGMIALRPNFPKGRIGVSDLDILTAHVGLPRRRKLRVPSSLGSLCESHWGSRSVRLQSPQTP